MNYYVIDRFEGIYAVCEDENKTISKVPKYKLPLECKEGDYLFQDSAGMYQIVKPDQRTTESRIRSKMGRLFENQ